MNILFSIHLYPPNHCAGAEMMVHDFAKYFKSKGHDVRVLCHYWGGENYEFEGIPVYSKHHEYHNPYALRDWSDCIFTHLDVSDTTEFHRGGKPLFHVIHNDTEYKCITNTSQPDNTFVVYNTEWIKEKLKYNVKSIVIRPTCDAEQFKPFDNPGDAITLININESKGSRVFYGLVRRNPHRKFIAVKGAYGMQVIRDYFKNVEFVDNSPDINEVYQKSRIVICPSIYESWGRVAREAIQCGIPVIATETPGLIENLGDAGIFCNRNKLNQWGHAISILDNPDKYREQVQKCLDRAAEFDSTRELNHLLKFVEKNVFLKC